MLDLHSAQHSVEAFYRRIYWMSPSATTQHADGFTLSYSGVRWLHSVNHLWVHDLDALTDSVLEQAAAFFHPFEADYSIVFSESEPTGIAQWLADRQCMERAANPIYGLSGLPRPHNVQREAHVVRAGEQHTQDMRDVLAGAFFIAPELGRSAVRAEHFSDPAIRHYVAYIEGEIAACATVILDSALAGLWNVGTLRPFRQQGVASALIMRALADAAGDGYAESVLLASPMGRSLYVEMGYRLLGSTVFYAPAHSSF